MHKVLIVDDEFLVRMGLKSTINWENNGFQLIGEAKNAKEAIELFQLFSPHIVLTDISMPGITGLDLIRKLKGFNPNLQAIILTHYEDFSYAQEAVGLDVVDYILKSNLSSERLLDVLKKARKRITRSPESEDSFYTTDVVKKLTTAEFLSLKNLLSSPEMLIDNIENQLLRYDTFFSHKFFQIFIFKINTNLSDQVSLDEMKKQALEKIIDQSMFAIAYTVHFCIEDDRIFFLVNFEDHSKTSNYKNIIFQHFQSLAGTIKKYLNLYILSGASSIGESLIGVRTLLYESNRSVEVAFFSNHHFAQYDANFDTSSRELKLDKGLVYELIKSGEHEKVMNYVEKILETAKQFYDYGGLYKIFSQSLDTVSKYVNLCAKEQNENYVSTHLLEYQNFYSLYDYEAVRIYLLNVYSQVLTIKTAEKGDNKARQYSYIIQRAIRYIEKNYYENISLSNVASYVEVSRSYFSFLFKHELGVNFSSFLAETRINQAKALLSQTNMKIYEIAEDVGFDSPYYFSKVFKEVSGLTCKEYRKIHFKEV